TLSRRSRWPITAGVQPRTAIRSSPSRITSMADGDEPRGKHASVKAWQEAVLGLDSDVWLRSYRRSLKPYATAGDALAFYTRIFDHAPVEIMILGPQFLIADANIKAQKLLQKPLEALRGKPFNRHIAKG